MKRHYQEANSISQAEGRKTSSLVNLVQLVVCYSLSPWRSGGIRGKYALRWSSRRNIHPAAYPRVSYYINNSKGKETGCSVCMQWKWRARFPADPRPLCPIPAGPTPLAPQGRGCHRLWDRSLQQAPGVSAAGPATRRASQSHPVLVCADRGVEILVGVTGWSDTAQIILSRRPGEGRFLWGKSFAV